MVKISELTENDLKIRIKSCKGDIQMYKNYKPKHQGDINYYSKIISQLEKNKESFLFELHLKESNKIYKQ